MDFLSSRNPELTAFYEEHARPGRMGLVHVDFAPAKLINWGQKRLTPDGKPSRWVHIFFFTEQRNQEWWIAESDVNVPLPGFRKNVTDGPQESPLRKWSGVVVDQAAIVDAGLTEAQTQMVFQRARELIAGGYFYGTFTLAGTWIAILKKDLSHRSILHRKKAMHCAHFVRECLIAAGCDPFGEKIRPANTAPETIYQTLNVIAEWKRP
jgi:hypothetical protein